MSGRASAGGSGQGGRGRPRRPQGPHAAGHVALAASVRAVPGFAGTDGLVLWVLPGVWGVANTGRSARLGAHPSVALRPVWRRLGTRVIALPILRGGQPSTSGLAN